MPVLHKSTPTIRFHGDAEFDPNTGTFTYRSPNGRVTVKLMMDSQGFRLMVGKAAGAKGRKSVAANGALKIEVRDAS